MAVLLNLFSCHISMPCVCVNLQGAKWRIQEHMYVTILDRSQVHISNEFHTSNTLMSYTIVLVGMPTTHLQ